MNDLELVEKVKIDGCNESFQILVDRHSPLFNKSFQQYAGRLKDKGISHQDFFREKEYVFFTAINSFDPAKKCKFSTWFSNCVRYHCLICLWNLNRFTVVSSEDFHFYQENSGKMDTVFNLDTQEILLNLIDGIGDELTKKVFMVRYFKNPRRKTSWRLVAKETGRSIRSCVKLHKRALPYLKSKLEKIDCQFTVDN
jgi:DNA-directed RNA polymerase specialized sigma subunit